MDILKGIYQDQLAFEIHLSGKNHNTFLFVLKFTIIQGKYVNQIDSNHVVKHFKS
jgi:hypothetical protein